MKIWYKTLAKTQKIYIYVIVTALVPFYGIGALPLAVLIYLELGLRGGNGE